MPSMSITIERTPLTLQWEGQDIQVEQLGIRLPFARKPENLKDMSASGDYLVYVTETRTMTPEEFDGFAANLLVSRDWLAGRRLSLADFAAAAHLSVIDYFGDVPWRDFPAVKTWYMKLKSRPCFRPLLADRWPGLAPAQHYDDLDF